MSQSERMRLDFAVHQSCVKVSSTRRLSSDARGYLIPLGLAYRHGRTPVDGARNRQAGLEFDVKASRLTDQAFQAPAQVAGIIARKSRAESEIVRMRDDAKRAKSYGQFQAAKRAADTMLLLSSLNNLVKKPPVNLAL